MNIQPTIPLKEKMVRSACSLRILVLSYRNCWLLEKAFIEGYYVTQPKKVATQALV